MNKQEMDKHVALLGGLYIGLDILFLLIAVLLFFLVTSFGRAVGGESGGEAARIIGAAIAAFLLLISIPGIIVGVGLLRRKSWARTIAIILAIVNIFNIPIGTILAVYSLWVLFNPDVENEFTRKDF